MKITIFLMFAFCMQLSAEGYSQKITISEKNAPLKKVFKEIEKQSGYVFWYEASLIQNNSKVNVSVKNAELKEVLELCFANQPVTYSILGKTIVLKEKPTHVIEPAIETTELSVPPISVKGKVTDQNGNPLERVSVMVKGTTKGTATNAKGEYNLNEVDENAILIFSIVGFSSQEVAIKKSTTINISLQPDLKKEDEIVIRTGIVNRRAESFTGAATTITKDELLRVSNKDIVQSLKILEPSLMIFDNLNLGSDPNALPEMTLRGSSSFPQEISTDLKGDYVNNPNQPLFILNGFEVGLTKVVDLDMNRIESITVLKDASAKAIYGAKAANGVVVIETKTNTGNKVLITYNGSIDIELPDLSSYNLTNSAEKLQAEKIYGLYSQISSAPPNYATQLTLDQQYNQRLKAVLSGVNTDWMSLPLRNGIGQKQGLSIELGDRDLSLIANFSYNNVAGVMRGSDRKVLSTSATMSYRHKGFLFRNIISFTDGGSNDSPYGSFGDYSKMNPYWTPYDQFGNLKANAETGLVPYVGSSFVPTLSFQNPLYNSKLNTKLSKQYTEFTDNLYAEVNLITGLKMFFRGSFTSTKNEADEFFPANHLKFSNYTGEDFFRKGSYKKNEGAQTRFSGDINASYNKPFGEKHLLFVNLGANVNQTAYEEIIYSAEGFPNDRMNDILFAKQYSKYQNRPFGSEGTTRDLGILSIASYSYDNRFFADASIRTSASSQFGSNKRWGTFWSTGLGWNIHHEKWVKSLNVFERLKVRGSIGSTGSQNFSSYQSIATYNYVLDRVYDGFLGAYLKGLANPDLRWQQKMDYNVGVDFSILRKLTGRFDYYKAITQNTLVDFTLPPSTGFSSVKENMGKIMNTGMELMLTYNIYSDPKNRSYFSVTGSAIQNKNVIVSISDALETYNEAQDKIANDRFNNKPVTKYYDGVSTSAIWAVRSLGIDPANGQEIFLNRNNEKTFTYSAGDQVVVGDRMPKISGSFGLNGEYRGIGLSAYFRFLYGGQMYNQTLINRVENVDMSYNVDKRVLNSTWQRPGDKKPYKALGSVEIQQPDGTWLRQFVRTQASDRFVMDQNEIAMSSLSLSYDFYRWNYLEKVGIERLRCAFYTNDVFTASTIPTERGLTYPFARKFSFSITASF